MLLYHFRKCDFYKFKATFAKSLMKKTLYIDIVSNFLQLAAIWGNFSRWKFLTVWWRTLNIFRNLHGSPFVFYLLISMFITISAVFCSDRVIKMDYANFRAIFLFFICILLVFFVCNIVGNIFLSTAELN